MRIFNVHIHIAILENALWLIIELYDINNLSDMLYKTCLYVIFNYWLTAFCSCCGGNFHRVKHSYLSYSQICTGRSRTVSERVPITLYAFDCATFSGSFLSSIFLERHLQCSIERMHLVESIIRQGKYVEITSNVTFISQQTGRIRFRNIPKKI